MVSRKHGLMLPAPVYDSAKRLMQGMKQTLYTIGILLNLVMIGSCAGPDQLPVYKLEREGRELYVTGTIHMLTEAWSDQVFPSTRLARDTIAASDVVFMEIDPDELYSVDEPDRSESLNVESLASLLKAEGDDVYEAFLRDLTAFPFMDHVGRQESLLRGAPREAYTYLSFDVMEVIASVSVDLGLDRAYYDVAREHGVPVEGLESLALLEGLDESSQSAYFEAVRALVSARPSEEDIKLAYDLIPRVSIPAMMSGSFPEAADELFYDALGVERSDLTQTDDDSTASASIDARHETWIRSLDGHLDSNRDHMRVFVAVGHAHLAGVQRTFLDELVDAGWSLVSEEPWGLRAVLNSYRGEKL